MMSVRNNPAAKKTFQLANLALLTFFLLAVPARLYPHFHPDLMDGVRGLFLGVTLGLLILTRIRSRKI